MTRKKTVKKKVEIVFDPQKRKDFLTGFRKRKNERRQRAKEELQRNVKEERKRIRQEIKDGIKHMKKTFEPLRELTDKDKVNEDEYEDDEVKVKIVELSTSDMAAQNHLIGENRTVMSESDVDNDDANNGSINEDPSCIPGMDFDNNTRKRKAADAASNVGCDDDSDETEPSKKRTFSAKASVDMRSKKDFDRHKKNKTLKKLKQSKVFKMKERVEKTANQKKAKRDKNNTIKSLPKHQRKNTKFEPTRYSKGRMLNRKQIRRQRT